MRLIKKNTLNQLVRTMGAAGAEQHITEALEQEHLVPEEFSIQDLAEVFLGREFIDACNPRDQSKRAAAIMEAGDATDVTTFGNITGQIVYSRMMQEFNNAAFVASQLVPAIPTRLDGEKIPGVARDTDAPEEVGAGMPYPRHGLVEDYIETPSTRKYGEIVPVTKEAIFFDRTNLVLRRAGEVGKYLGVLKEKILMDAIAGVASTFATGGKWKRKGTEYSVYNTTTVDFEDYWYINAHTAALTDWTDVDEAELLFANMQDANTREPILVGPNLTLLVVPALASTADRIVNATEVDAYTASSTIETKGPNPLRGRGITPVQSRYFYRRLIDAGSVSAANAAKYWILGDFSQAFAWMENWPITITQAPTNSEAEFDRDIIAQFKSTMCGSVAVLSPYHVIRSTGAG